MLDRSKRKTRGADLNAQRLMSKVSPCTVIWLYFTLKIFRTLLFRTVLISYAPHIVYETCEKFIVEKYSYV